MNHGNKLPRAKVLDFDDFLYDPDAPVNTNKFTSKRHTYCYACKRHYTRHYFTQHCISEVHILNLQKNIKSTVQHASKCMDLEDM